MSFAGEVQLDVWRYCAQDAKSSKLFCFSSRCPCSHHVLPYSPPPLQEQSLLDAPVMLCLSNNNVALSRNLAISSLLPVNLVLAHGMW